MKKFAVSAAIAALGALAGTGRAYAIEPGSVDPHLPGVSDGVPAGALAPQGFYFVNTLAYNVGSVQNGNGDPIAANTTAWIDIPAVTWTTPLHILGAEYAVALTQPLLTAATTGVAGAGVTQNKTGLFNTVITPAILSWHLPLGFFVSGSFSVYAEDGDTGGRGNGTMSQEHLANNTWTFAPGAAVSWFNGHGLETSINLEYDIQTQNTDFVGVPGETVKYQSGDLLNLDFTVQQVLPGAFRKWTLGAVGYYVVQIGNDQETVNGVTTTVPASPANGTGNRFEKFALGPIVGYDFGPVAVQAYYTQDLYAKNTQQTGTFFFRFAVPL